MKNNIKYIKLISIFVLALVISAACVKWDEETRPSLDPASSVTLAVISAGDSSVVISFSNSSNGYVALNLYEGTSNEVPTELEDREAMLTGNVSSMAYHSAETEVGTVYQHTFEGLVQDASYEVLGVANNGDGIVSEVVVQVVNTADSHPPVLSSTEPGVGYDPVLPLDGPVVLVFDEPVLYDDTKDLTFSEWYDAADVVAGSVVVSGNTVTVTPGEDFTNRDYVLLSYPEGAFTDLSGNLAAAVDSYLDGGAFVGLYWRAEAKDFEAVSFTPADAYIDAGGDITVTFAEGVDADDVEDGDITLTYDDGLDVLTKAVLASDVSAAGNVLTVAQSHVAAQGVEVTLNIPAELLGIGYGNPNAEVTSSWIIAHPTLQTWVGNYMVAAASYAVPGSYDEVWAASVEAVPSDINVLAITLNAGYGGGIPFLATLDAGALTISIAPGTNAGDLYGYGTTAMYVGDYATIDQVATIVGTLVADGTILIDQLAMYLSDLPYYWDAFNTTWTKSAKKAAPGVAAYGAKAARLN